MRLFKIIIADVDNKNEKTLCTIHASDGMQALNEASGSQFGTIQAFQKQYGQPHLKYQEVTE